MTGSSRSTTRAPTPPSTLRSSACAQTAPNMPVLAPTTATSLPLHGLAASGRESQSRAFFRKPGIEWLYSGVANRIASACSTALAQRADRAGAAPTTARPRRRRDLPQELRVEDRQLGACRQQVDCRPQEPRVVRLASQAAGDAEDDHRYACAATNSRLIVSVTSFSTAKPPLGSGAFQFRPNAVRSIVVVELDADLRVAGDVLGRLGDVAGGGDALRRALDRQVAVDLDRTPSPIRRTAVETNVICGVRSASKKSGPWRWP